MSTSYHKLRQLLEELFQFNREDLDFGIYRIMNQKRVEIFKFLDQDLLPQVEEAFSEYRAGDEAQVHEELARLEKTLGDAGVTAESSPKYLALKERLVERKDLSALENEVYSDLYTFFRRYYKNGDFLSLRRYKPGVYAVPYEGEEVKLHWANADQYYIKTAENFRNYRFKLEGVGYVNFDLVSATTERDNNKPSNGKERRFVLREEDPVEETDGELHVYFEYRPHPDKQDALRDQAREAIFENGIGEWKAGLAELRPTQSNKNRTLLEKHLAEYTARNTFDYFIHKDLGGFLRRELDFFLKNEVLHIDDLDIENEQRVGQYLSKLKVIKRIGYKVISFLGQIEDFQKKLFLKKKFVVSSGYCLTLDNVPEELYGEISANDAQYEEWERLFAISEIPANLENGGGNWRSIEWLKANPYLALDTKFFDADFEDRLLASIEDLDEKTDGLLINSENFQALELLQERYRAQVKCIYIDPPYNAKSSEILYKNSYKHSSWLSLIQDRLLLGRNLSTADGTVTVAIDENEQERLGMLLGSIFPEQTKTCVTIVHNPGGIQGTNFSYSHEYAYFVFPPGGRYIGTVRREQADVVPFRDWGGEESKRETAKNCFYPIFVKNGSVVGFGDVCPDDFHPDSSVIEQEDGIVIVYPVDSSGVERKWRFARQSVDKIREELVCEEINNERVIRRYKSEYRYKTVWTDRKYNSNAYGSKLLGDILGTNQFSFPKSVHTVADSIHATTQKYDSPYVLDYFAGSGTTGHAVINLNREDNGKRKYILVEMGEYFETVLKPRIMKVIYSKDWKNGKPVSREGTSHIFKYMTLESYEDTLNNLSLRRTDVQDDLIESNAALREEYMLSYMLDFETKGSPSLLNLDSFEDPFSYRLNVTRDDETRPANVDLVETFDYLLGLTVSRRYSSDGFRVIEGANPAGEGVLVIWRNTRKKTNDDLDAFFIREEFADAGFERVYANGDNTLALKAGDAKIHLIEEEFRRLMFASEGV